MQHDIPVGRLELQLPFFRNLHFNLLCETSLTSLFSSLQIVPRFGPLNGRISVTIKGSNMGIKKEDIKKITVAGVDCVHQEDRYSVSTR